MSGSRNGSTAAPAPDTVRPETPAPTKARASRGSFNRKEPSTMADDPTKGKSVRDAHDAAQSGKKNK
ncbi:hypothetical protein [Spirillospora sp. CA-128828]|uniref:hypothetical protein n=1 Tax=Spirillospora sp. CA-128828 TaxID=3240033 RepID=UPI003D924104